MTTKWPGSPPSQVYPPPVSAPLDPPELLEPLVPADLADVEAVLAVDPAAVRPELELPGLGPLLAPRADLLAVWRPDLDPAPADDVEDPIAIRRHVARTIHPGDLGDE